MAFSKQIQQLCAGVSAEQAVSLRDFIVYLSERIKTNPGVWNTGLQVVFQEAADEGYNADEVLATLHKLAEATLTVEAQAQFAGDLESHLARNASISEFAATASFTHSPLAKRIPVLLEAAIAEKATLTCVAGGTSHKTDITKSWTGWSTATKKQKYKKIGIDALEFFAIGSLVNRVAFNILERGQRDRVFKRISEENPELLQRVKKEGWRIFDIPGIRNAILRAEDGWTGHRYSLKFERWSDRLTYEFRKTIPGAVIYHHLEMKARAKAEARRQAEQDSSSNSDSDSGSDADSDFYTEMESDIVEVNPRRIELEAAGNHEFDVLSEDLKSIYVSPRSKSHPTLDRSWRDVAPDYGPKNVRAGIQEEVDEAAIGIIEEFEDAAKGVIKDDIRATDAFIEDAT